MNKLLLSLMLMLLCLTACSDELAISVDDQVTFSTDTVSMGTLLVGNSSRTHLVKLYNHCKGELKLSSITLRGGSKSQFRMNVDGMNGTSFTNSDLLRIAQGDSMFVFVEATFSDDHSLWTEHRDYIDVLCNGRLSSIVLDAASMSVDQLVGQTILRDTVWTSDGRDKQIFDSLVVPQGVTLTICDSVTVYLHDKADIVVRGTLICEGQLGRPVILRGDRMDRMFDNLPYDNLPSQWGTMYIDSTAHGCRFIHTDIHGMTGGIRMDSTDVLVEHSRLKNSGQNLLTCHMTELNLRNSELSNAGGALVQIFGGRYDITHCTLANYNFTSLPTLPAVHLCNLDTAMARYTPLYTCRFLNTLIWSKERHKDMQEYDVRLDYYRVVLGQDEYGYNIIPDSVFSYQFDHCLIKAKGTNDDDFISIQWNKDPLYSLIDPDNYTYDFHLTPQSPAVYAGDSLGLGISICPIDLEGNPRTQYPNIGCYEIIKEKQ